MVKHDLPLPVADSNLHCRCDYRKDEYEDMRELEALNAIAEIIIAFYKEDNERLKKENEEISKDIQHVGYDDAQCGREK